MLKVDGILKIYIKNIFVFVWVNHVLIYKFLICIIFNLVNIDVISSETFKREEYDSNRDKVES